MAHVYLPAQMRALADGHPMVVVDGATVRQLIDELDRRFPGARDRLCVDGRIRSGLCVSINGSISSLGLLARVQDTDEIHFLPAIGGG